VCVAQIHINNWCAATATIARGINEVVCLLVICLFFNSSSLKQERVFAFNSSSFKQLQAPLLAGHRELVTIVTA
jgi:ABC-type arginine transport system permease subunit